MSMSEPPGPGCAQPAPRGGQGNLGRPGIDPDAMEVVPVTPSLLGESPLWHPQEDALYWCDIPGRQLNRWSERHGHAAWQFDCEPACCAPVLGGGLLLAMRSGLWHFDPATGARNPVADPPYDPAVQRFNDGKADPQGRFWVGTLHEPRDQPAAQLYRFAGGRLDAMAGNITVSNGLAWSPDGATMYWADTKAHTVYALDFDAAEGSLARRRVFASFPVKQAGQDLSTYGGRPDGAAVDSEGCYWVAMFEGARVLRLSPGGEVLQEMALPVRCPTMPCFGGTDLRTLYITTSRENRPLAELAREPLAGRVLMTRVDVPGLPAHCVYPWRP
jgi:sugar lactone lactonase YvrE